MTLAEPVWRKSSRCASNACVEVAPTHGGVMVRDSKNPDQSLEFEAGVWAVFLQAVQADEFGDLA